MHVWVALTKQCSPPGEEVSVLRFPETARISGGVCEPP